MSTAFKEQILKEIARIKKRGPLPKSEWLKPIHPASSTKLRVTITVHPVGKDQKVLYVHTSKIADPLAAVMEAILTAQKSDYDRFSGVHDIETPN